MRYLLALLLLACASVCAQNVNELPLYGESKKAQSTQDDDRRYIESAIKTAGSREAAARLETFRGWRHLKQGDTEVAIQCFNYAWLLTPNNVEVFWGLGVAMTQQAKYDIAVRLFQRALVIEPQNPRLLADVGLAHARAAVGISQDPVEQAKRLQGAMLWFDAAQKLDPDYPLVYANRAVALYFLGKFSESWVNVEKAESLDRTSVDQKLITDLSKKMPRPASASVAPVPDTPTVKTETVTAQATVQAASPLTQPVAKTEIPKVPQGTAENSASAAKTVAQTKPEVQSDIAPVAKPVAPAAVEARVDAAPANAIVVQPLPVIKTQAVPAKTAAQPTVMPSEDAVQAPQEKKLRVITGQPVRPIGPDKRACLDLPTNEAIMRCVYPRK